MRASTTRSPSCVAEAESLAADEQATDLQRATARDVLDLLQTTRLPERLLELPDATVRGARAAAFSDARKAVRALALEELASRDRELLQELLTGFATAYTEAKNRESALDFEDLQLRARKLLREHDSIREVEQLRFRSIMVDEFQDTNNLQTDLIDLLCAGPPKELFFVGDEFQSIYGFRHADVAVFRDRREAAPHVLPLTLNYRSRPEVLAAVNELFDDEFGESFQELTPGRGLRRPGRSARRSSCSSPTRRRTPTPGSTGAAPRRGTSRAACASSSTRAPPRRARSSFSSPPGPTPSGSRRSCGRVDLPTIRMTGRRYFGQQQVVDLLHYLRLLQNRYDDEALLTVLASPFVGVSNDALVLIRATAERRPIFKGIERTLPSDLAEDDRRLVRAFLQRYERLVESSTRLSLELLCERILVEHDYDLAVLARRDGQRRYANLRKLARLARSYEELRGPDIEGFIRFVGEQDAVGAPERDAVSEEEGADAVRLLTIHAAKGLEFKVVVVADAGRERSRTDEILCLSDGRFGFKVAHPGTGSRVSTTSYQEVKETQDRAEDAERLRLYYVAMTRAMDRLIVSGSVDRSSERDERTPIGWVLGRLGLGRGARPRRGARPGRGRAGQRGCRAADRPLRAGGRGRAGCGERLPRASDEEGQLVLFEGAGEEIPAAAPRLRELVEIPRAAARASSRGSPTARSRSTTAAATATTPSASPGCSRRRGSRGRTATGPAGLHPTEIGDAVHRLLELVDLAGAGGARSGGARRARRCLVSGRLGGRAGADRRASSRSYTGSALAARIAGLHGRPARAAVRVRARRGARQRPARRALARGRAGARARLQDERAARPRPGRDRRGGVPDAAGRLRDRLPARRARARSRSSTTSSRIRTPSSRRVFTAEDAPRLEAGLSASIARIRAGEFRPTPSAFACSGCPALDVVCAGPRLGGRGDRVAPRARVRVRGVGRWRGATSRRRAVAASGRGGSGSGRSSSGSPRSTPTPRSRSTSGATSSC